MVEQVHDGAPGQLGLEGGSTHRRPGQLPDPGSHVRVQRRQRRRYHPPPHRHQLPQLLRQLPLGRGDRCVRTVLSELVLLVLSAGAGGAQRGSEILHQESFP
ncbi:MAG: hypothetical protein ABSA93_31385 [Streptosporangiaceae bacterium]